MKYRLVCFDLDGTVIDETIFIWRTLHEHFGTSREARQKAMDDFHSGRISYADWARHDIRLLKEGGAKKEGIMAAIQKLRPMAGARETLKELKRRGYTLAVISGSLDIALEHALPDHSDYFDDVLINRITFDEDGHIVSIAPTRFDMEHKATGLKMLADREGIKMEQCVFVGDHSNDIKVAEAAGFSIAFNCKSDELARVSDVVIMKKDLREILKYLD